MQTFLMHIPRKFKGWYLEMCVYLVSDIKALLEIDWIGFAIALLALLGAFVGVCKLGSEVLTWIGKPVGWAKQRKEDHEMILKNAQAIKELAELHKKDTKTVNEHEDKLREDLTLFMTEVRNDIKQFADNRINDREKSRSIQAELNERINNMAVTDKHRDETVSLINENLSKLTDMFVDKQINDYRWEIINFATAISEKKPCTKEGFKHCFATYERYEKILEAHGLENGEVEISMEIINEAYKEKMKNGEF